MTTSTTTSPTDTTIDPTTTGPTTISAESTLNPAERWAGVDFSALDRFLTDTAGESFAIADHGELVHEWYRTDPSHLQDAASAQKSVLSLLIGRAVADGAFSLDTNIDQVLGPDWTPHGQSAAITVEHLLTMTSGLDDALAVVAAPGTTWIYSGVWEQLFGVLTTTTGRDLNDLAAEWLFDPIGATRANYYERQNAQFSRIGLRVTAQDLMAVGQSVLDRTIPGVDDEWLDASFASTPTNLAYGYLWWLNGRAPFKLPGQLPSQPTDQTGPLIPSAPMDTVAALGKDDQKLYVSRDLGLVVARQGGRAVPESRSALSGFDDRLWEMLLDLRRTD